MFFKIDLILFLFKFLYFFSIKRVRCNIKYSMFYLIVDTFNDKYNMILLLRNV